MVTACALTLIVGFGPLLCCPRDRVLATIDDRSRYHERQVSTMLWPQGLVERWQSHKTGSYTVLLTHPNGLSCPITSGRVPPEVTS